MASMDNADRALNAIRKKYATTADVAKRLGFSADWEDLENGGGWDMRSSPSRDQGGPTPFPGMPRPGQGPSDQLSYGASESYDDRDDEAAGEEIAYLVRSGGLERAPPGRARGVRCDGALGEGSQAARGL